MSGEEKLAAPPALAAGRSSQLVRPARLSSREAERLFAELLDDAIRSSERGKGAVSNAAIGEACESTESKVRAWRDPDGGRPMTAYRLLQLPDSIARSLTERVAAKRLELRGEHGPESTTTAAAIAVGSMGRALCDIGAALADGNIDAGERECIASLLLVVMRDAQRLLARMGRPGS